MCKGRVQKISTANVSSAWILPSDLFDEPAKGTEVVFQQEPSKPDTAPVDDDLLTVSSSSTESLKGDAMWLSDASSIATTQESIATLSPRMDIDYSNMYNVRQPSFHSQFQFYCKHQEPAEMIQAYQVDFKFARRYYVHSAHTPRDIRIGNFVIVEGDRGEDIGVVSALLSMREFVALRAANEPVDEDRSIKRVIRMATQSEIEHIQDKFYEECQVIEFAKETAKYYHLPMVILDAEYQFDRRKLTIYYDALTAARVDFRKFVKIMYMTYKARIWMKKGF